MDKLHFVQTIWEDCILLESNGEYAMIDTGMPEHFDVIKKYLKKLNIPKLKFILITHFHRDHYGNLDKFLDMYKVDNLYIKRYSKLDGSTNLEKEAVDEYREKEWKKYLAIVEKGNRVCNVIEIDESIKFLSLGNFNLTLYNTKDRLKEIYNNKDSVNYYKYRYNENYNCVLILVEIFGKTIYLTSDIPDEDVEDEELKFLNLNTLRHINKTIDIYKIPHHGVSEYNPIGTLKFVHPKYAIITNWKEELEERFSILNDLETVCPNSKVYLTENNSIVFNFDKDKVEISNVIAD